MKRVAVTGATGFLGQHLLPCLRDRGVDVVATGRRDRPPTWNDANGRFATCDVKDPVGAFDKLGRPDVLIHLAWGGLPNYRSPEHIEEELPAHQRFLDGCLADGLSQLVVIGTCFEYGSAQGELKETLPCEPITTYGAAKNMLHQHLRDACASRKATLSWVRLFYLYGTGQASSSLFAQLMHALDTGATSFDMSPGKQLRDFLPVEDAAALIARLALEPAGYGAVNVCSGTPVTVEDQVRHWLATAGRALDLNLGIYPYSQNEPMAFWGSRMKLDDILCQLDGSATNTPVVAT